MFKDVLLKEDAPYGVKVFLEFLSKRNYDEFTFVYDVKKDLTEDKCYENNTKSFYDFYVKEDKETFLKNIGSFDISMFNFKEAKDKKFKNIFFKTFCRFFLELISLIKNNGVIPIVKYSVTSASPPLTFKRGNNKLEIKPTGKDYGFLF